MKASKTIRSTDLMMSEGLAVWQSCMRGTSLEGRALLDAVAMKYRITNAARALEVVSCALWCKSGFPLIDIESAKYAAALALTDVCDRPMLPWDTFVVRIPPGIVQRVNRHHPERGSIDITTITISRSPLGVVVHVTPSTCIEDADGNIARGAEGCFIVHQDDIAEGARGKNEETWAETGETVETEQSRGMTLCLRIALNAAEALTQHQTRSGASERHAACEAASEPRARRFVVGSPIAGDFREAVRAYCTGRRATFRKLHWPVRGYWINQVHGEGRALRRREWRPPHWAKRSGTPDDAPILMREHKLVSP